MPDSKMPDAPDSAEPNAAQLSGADLARLLEQNKTLADARGVSQDTCEALYAHAFAALQKKDYENAFYLFSFLVLHRHDTDAYWQGLGHAQAGLGNYAAAAMTLLVPYERKPGAELALELAKNFTQCGLHELAQHYADEAETRAQKRKDKKLAGRARLLRERLQEAAS